MRRIIFLSMITGFVGCALVPLTSAQDRFIFPESSNGDFLLDQGVDEAVSGGKRVLIFWGTNDSEPCQQLDRVLSTDSKVLEVLDSEYVVVRVDPAWNAGLAQSLGSRIDRVPALSVVDPFNGLVADRANASAAGTEVLGFLYQHRPKPSEAENYFDRAREAARASDKSLFVLFTTTWCGWCNKLKETLADPTIAPIIGQHLTYIEIDQEHVDGARALRYRLSQNSDGGIPWYTVVSPDGDVLASIDGKRGMAGYPSGRGVNQIIMMFRSGAPNMSEEDVENLRSNLLRVTRFATRPEETVISDSKLTIR